MTRKATVPIVLTLPWLTSSAIGALLLLVVSSVRADAPPSPNWLKEITRVAYTGLPNSQRWADWPDRVIADFASAGVQMMFSRVHNGRDSPGLAWRSAYGDPQPGHARARRHPRSGGVVPQAQYSQRQGDLSALRHLGVRLA